MRHLLATALMQLVLVTSANASIIFSDDFGSGANSGGLSSIPGWTVTGNVDLWNFFTPSGRSVDLDGTNSSATIESQAILNLVPNTLYELSFSYGNNSSANNILQFSVGSILTETLPTSTAGTPPFTTIARQFSVLAASTATLRFAELGPANSGGSIIDDVQLEDLGQIGVPVPAPATLFLFGLGLAGLGWSRRKKA